MKDKIKISETEVLPTLEHNRPVPELPSLAAGLVHEVKNPLAAIHMHLQLLEGYLEEVDDQDLKNKLKGKASLIKNEISKLNQTLHSFFKLFNPRINKDKHEYHLNSLIEEVIRLLEPQALHDNIHIFLKKDVSSQKQSGNPAFIRQIVLNLALNAIQVLKSPRCKRKEKHVHIETLQKGDLLRLRVKDNGPGISAEVQKKMFEAFYTTNRDKAGHGLGLTLVQRMVASMGGQLELESKLGKGSCFTVTWQQDAKAPKLLEQNNP